MRCSVPLELELTILEFAAPPLAIDRLHDRVAFFIKISLVHRSITAWAQDRLRDQFLYTYYRRLDEYERLKARFDAGFGRNRSVRRLYLDLTRLPREGRERTRSIFTAVGGWAYRLISSVGRRSVPAEADMRAQEQARQEVANFVPYGDDPNDGYWELCGLITAFSQTLDTLWLKAPLTDLDITDLPRGWALSARLSQSREDEADDRILLQRLAYSMSTITPLTILGTASARFPLQAGWCCSCGTSVSPRTTTTTMTNGAALNTLSSTSATHLERHSVTCSSTALALRLWFFPKWRSSTLYQQFIAYQHPFDVFTSYSTTSKSRTPISTFRTICIASSRSHSHGLRRQSRGGLGRQKTPPRTRWVTCSAPSSPP